MIQVQNLSFSISDIHLLTDVNWTIKSKRRIGLIGPNGAGKTTFFRILTGEYQPTSGNLSIPKKVSIGYLPQEEIQFEQNTILKLVLSGHEELLEIENEIDEIHTKLDENHHDKVLIGRLKPTLRLRQYPRRDVNEPAGCRRSTSGPNRPRPGRSWCRCRS